MSQPITSIRQTIVTDCPFCDAVGTLTQDAAIATGEPIIDRKCYGQPHLHGGTADARIYCADREDCQHPFVYEPRKGEVLKNHYMVCSACGADQGS